MSARRTTRHLLSSKPGKLKIRKRNNIMKNRTIQFKPTTLRCKNTGLLLACLTAVFFSAPNSASARDQVPFNGTVSGYVETSEPVSECVVHGHASNFGNATQVGAFTGSGELYQDFCEDPPNITYTGTFHWFAANGDELSGIFGGYLSPTETPGVYENHQSVDLTAGTGRFTSATGHWGGGGPIDVTTVPLFFSGQFHGWISSVGSTRQ
jgi:hypothetical protein